MLEILIIISLFGVVAAIRLIMSEKKRKQRANARWEQVQREREES